MLVFAGAFALGSLSLVGFRLARSGSLPGVEVQGEDLGGLEGAELRTELARLSSARRAERVTLERAASGSEDTSEFEGTGADLGYQVDVAATADRILERGRQANPLAALADHLLSLGGTISVEPVDGVDPAKLSKWLDDADEKLSVPPDPGGVEFSGATPGPRYPKPGEVLDRGDLGPRLGAAARRPGDDSIEATTEQQRPPTDESDVDALVERAERATSQTVTLARPNGALRFTPVEVAGLLSSRTVETKDEVSLELYIKPKRLKRDFADAAEALETEPKDASFTLSGTSVEVVPSTEGFAFTPKTTARQLIRVALSKKSSATLEGRTVAADFSTKDAKKLDITERVSSFTTSHACCEPRVANIHRIADLVDGVVIEPGESFSLNDFVGPRTTANGFVGAPAIRDGEFVEEIGGGISQFATTFFNAIFFGGYDFLEYQAHSYYIDRYPMGREATISTPAPDLAFLNDSDAGIYVDTSYSATSITVTFYGNTDVEVTADAGAPHDYRRPETECRVDKSLKRGEEVVLDAGHTGFDIVVDRVFSNGGTEEFFTAYDSSPRIVERRSCG